MFRADPHGATRTFQNGDKVATMDEAFAKLAQDIAWETVTELSAWTGVGNSGVVPPVPASAVALAQNAGGSAMLFTIDGRAVATIGQADRVPAARTGVSIVAQDGILVVTGVQR